MALSSFQRALCDLVRSPDLCRVLLAAPADICGRYDLSAREQRRLVAMVGQRGMSLNCTLYRVNRIAPIYTLLPRTCFLLGADLARESELYWATHEDAVLQFMREAERFAAFLRGRVRGGVTLSAFLSEILDLELAMGALQYRPPAAAACGDGDGDRLQLHPLVRLVRFQHEPTQLMRCLTEMRRPPADLGTGEFWILLRAGQEPPEGTPADGVDASDGAEAADATASGVVIERIDPALGRGLATLEAGVNAAALGAGEAAALIDAGLAVRGRR